MSRGLHCKYVRITAEQTAVRLAADDSSRGTLNKDCSTPLLRQVLGNIMRRASSTDHHHFAPPTDTGRSVFARMEDRT